jgi:hypothetical protein
MHEPTLCIEIRTRGEMPMRGREMPMRGRERPMKGVAALNR